jgi:hypothetical protein
LFVALGIIWRKDLGDKWRKKQFRAGTLLAPQGGLARGVFGAFVMIQPLDF